MKWQCRKFHLMRFSDSQPNQQTPLKLTLSSWEMSRYGCQRGPWDGELLFFPESSQWDRAAFEAALNDYLSPRWDELCAAIHAQTEESPAPWQTEYSGDLIGG
jgi:hypothetical protein